MTLASDRFIALHINTVSSEPAAPDQRAGDNHGHVLHGEPRHRRRQTRAGIQNRNDHRHVRPANRQNLQNAQNQGKTGENHNRGRLPFRM